MEFFVRNTWYNSSKVTRAFIKEYEADYTQVHLSSDSKNPLAMQLFEVEDSHNLMPLHGYASAEISNYSPSSIFEVLKINDFSNCAAAFIPTASFNRHDIDISKHANVRYIERVSSYQIDLQHDLKVLKQRVSERRRPKLEPKKNQVTNISINSSLSKAKYHRVYSKNAIVWGLSPRMCFSESFFENIFELEQTIVFEIEDSNRNSLMHCIGLNEDKTHAEFVFSAGEGAYQHLSSSLIWQEIKWLHSQGVKFFHLGGGVKEGDGLSDFKRQFGGHKIFNGGFAIIFNQDKYLALCRNNEVDEVNFFPPYLKNYYI